jgi:hypothetical protein
MFRERRWSRKACKTGQKNAGQKNKDRVWRRFIFLPRIFLSGLLPLPVASAYENVSRHRESSHSHAASFSRVGFSRELTRAVDELAERYSRIGSSESEAPRKISYYEQSCLVASALRAPQGPLLPAEQPDVGLGLFQAEIEQAVVGRERQASELVRRNGEDLLVFPGLAVHQEELSAGAKK